MDNPHSILARTDAQGRQFADVLAYLNGGYWIDDHHILQGPAAVYDPVFPEASNQPYIWPYSAILHSNAGSVSTGWRRLFSWYRRADVSGESHFDVGYDQIAQAIPLNRRADCNYKANSWLGLSGNRLGAISFETQDNGGSTLAATPWTLDQLGCIVGALTAICVCYGVWCTAPAAWDDTGIGYHSQFPQWSIYVGKTCPGAARIRQMDYIRAQVVQRLAAFIGETSWTCGSGGLS